MSDICRAEAGWSGGKEGAGTLTTDSRTLTNVPFSGARNMVDARATNPDELLAAALAASVTVSLSARLAQAGHAAEVVRVRADLSLAGAGGDSVIEGVALDIRADVAGVSDADLVRHASAACADSAIARLIQIPPEITVRAVAE